MSNTIKKRGNVSVTTKSGKNFSYGFVTLGQIHEWLDENGLSYEATIQRVDDREYMFITKIDKDGKKSQPMQGSRIPAFTGDLNTKSATEIMQDYGIILSMARRYSLMLAYGLAPADDAEQPKQASSAQPSENKLDFNVLREEISELNSYELEQYKNKVLSRNLTPSQKSAVLKIFGQRHAKILAENMGFKKES